MSSHEPIPDDHPDHPDKELRDIALQAAARAARIDDLSEDVKTLTTEVKGLRDGVSKAVSTDELRRSERKVLVPLTLIAIGALLALVAAIFGGFLLLRLTNIAHENRANGDYLVSCTTPPLDSSPKEQKAHACWIRLRSDPQTTATVHQLECISLIGNGISIPSCGDVRAELLKQGAALSPAPPTPPKG